MIANREALLVPARRRHRLPAGFTILEILLVVALLGLTSLLFVSGASEWLRAKERTPEDIFWQAVSEARQLALRGDFRVDLRYDEKTKQLQWFQGDQVQSLAWPGRSLEFLPVQETNTVLLGGSLVETGRLAVVHFYPDGACDPFRVQLAEADGRRRTLTLDPWTCAPMLSGTSASR